MKYYFTALLVMTAFFVNAQNQKVLIGKVTVENGVANNILVANLSVEKTVYTDLNGKFEIMASPGDLVVFSGNHIQYHRKLIEEIDFKSSLIINLSVKNIAIDEVQIVNYKNLDAVSLGVLSKPAKKYTSQERKLRTAEKFFWYSPLLIPFGGMSLDGLINKMNGKTTQLKKDIEIEQKLRNFTFLKNMNSDGEFDFLNSLDSNQLESFFYFAIENKNFSTIVAAQNRNKIRSEIVLVFNEFKEQ